MEMMIRPKTGCSEGRGKAPALEAPRFRPNVPWILGLLVWVALVAGAAAQESELTLYVRRNFGYGGGDQIQGNFRLEIDSPADLISVTYRVDDAVVATVTEPPFRVDFETDAYPHGWHELVATAQTSDGRTLTSNTRRFEFVSAEAGWQAAGELGGTILVGVGGVIAVVIGLQVLVLGRGGTRHAGYGALGAAVCPRCGRPFGIHWWALNGVGTRYDRCDHCGKWSNVRRATAEALAAAEAAEVPAAAASGPEALAEREQRQLDDTRYVDEV